MSKVTLTDKTYKILKNFSTINSSILVRKGNVLKTISVGENAVAEYQGSEDFPQTFAIYDLPQFLSGLSLFEQPTLEFDNDSYVTIAGSNGRSARYYFSNPEITLKSAPEKEINFPDTDIEFAITADEIQALQKASLVYNLPDLSITSDGSTSIILNLCDKEDATCNVYSQTINGQSTGNFQLFMKVENIRLFPGDYTVKVSSKLITEWKHQTHHLKYYIALEP